MHMYCYVIIKSSLDAPRQERRSPKKIGRFHYTRSVLSLVAQAKIGSCAKMYRCQTHLLGTAIAPQPSEILAPASRRTLAPWRL